MRGLLICAAVLFTVDCQDDRLDPIAEEHMTKSRLWDEHVEREARRLEQNRKDNKVLEEGARKWDREHPAWYNNWGRGRDGDYDSEERLKERDRDRDAELMFFGAS